MKAPELRSKTINDLRQLLNDSEKQRFHLKMQAAVGQPVKPDQLKKLKKQIAQINGVLSEKGKSR